MSESAFSDDRPAGEQGKERGPSGSSSRLPIILAIGVVVIGLIYFLRPVPPVGIPLSGLQLAPLVGDAAPLALGDLRGKVTLINFWGTWCGPCRIELPELVKMSERLKSNPDFQFIPVSCPPGQDIEFEKLKVATEAFYLEYDFDLPAHFDPGAVTRFTLMQDLQLSSFSFPTTVLLDREGNVQALWIGYQPGLEAQMEKTINKHLR
jgi:thiol-disulfide isomerase/thioredoxin